MKSPPADLELDIGKLCAAIEQERCRRQLTHCEVSDQLGVSNSTYGYWRSRGTSMTGGAAVRVSIWLDRDLRDFTTERPARPPADPLPASQGQAA